MKKKTGKRIVFIFMSLAMVLTLFTALTLPAEAAPPNGTYDVKNTFNAPFGTPETGIDGMAGYAQWNSTWSSLTYDGGTIGGNPSSGISMLNPDPGCYINIKVDNGTYTDANTHWFKVTSDNVNVTSFQLTGLTLQTPFSDDAYMVIVTGTKSAGGTVSNIFFFKPGNSSNTSVSGNLTAFDGIQITSFQISFIAGTGTSQGDFTPGAGTSVSNFTFVDFSISNATAPSLAPATTVTGASLSADTGSSSSDWITDTADQTINGSLSDNLAADEKVEVSYDNGSTWSDATSYSSGTSSWSTTTTLSGSGTFKARVTNASGSSALYSHTYTLDTTAPATAVVSCAFSADTGSSSTDFITRTSSQTISGTLSANLAANETVYVSLNNGVSWTVASSTVGQNTWSLAGVTLSGSNTLKVKVTDAAGNDGTVLSQAYVLDTMASTTTIASAAFSADTGSSSTDFITMTASQTISGTLSSNLAAGETVYVSLDNGSTWSAASILAGQNTWSLAGVTLSGSSTLKARVTDTAGNDGTVLSQAYVVDTMAPTTTIATAAFSADTGTSSNDFITKTTTQTISGTLSANLAAGETVYVSLDNGSTWSAAPASAGQNTWSLTGQTLTGSNTLKVKVTDTAGNDGSVMAQAYVLDTMAPTTTIASAAFSADTGTSSTDFITKTASQTISGTLSANLAAGESVYVSLDNGTSWTSASSTAGQSIWSLAGQTLTGSNTMKIKVTDTAGNDGNVFSQAYQYINSETTTIATAAFSADTGTSSTDFITNTAAQTVSGTLSVNVAAGETVYVSLDNGSTWSVASASVGQNTWFLAGQTLTGSNTLKVKVTDAAGNDSSVFSQPYTLDTAAPVTFAVSCAFSDDTGSSNTDFITKTASQTITGTLNALLAAGETVYVSLDNGASWTSESSSSGSTWFLAGVTLTGSNTLKVKVTDVAGNDSSVFSQAYVLETTPPALVSATRTDNTTITVTLSKNCTTTTDQANDGGFTVTESGTPANIYTVSNLHWTDATHVALTVTDMSASAKYGVTVKYTAGGNGMVQDMAGNAMSTGGTGVAVASWASASTTASRGSSSSNTSNDVVVNGVSYSAGTTTTTTNSDGQSQTTVSVDTNKLNTILEQKGKGATVTVPITGSSDVAMAALTGDMMNKLQDNGATLAIQTNSASYILPASNIDMSAITQQFGSNIDPTKVTINVSIAEPTDATAKIVADAAGNGGFTIAIPPVNFTVTCSYNGQTASVTSFNSYVQRTITIPDGVDPSKITTGVVVDPDGTVHHVPTRVTVIDGKYYAVINSLTNSTYTVIRHSVEFADVTNNWAKDSINDMGSRMVITGMDGKNYQPGRDITRSEFAAIVVRALGLEKGMGPSKFSDVKSTDWYCGYVETAVTYGLIKGYDNGTFRPNDKITREQVMAISTRTMVITKLSTALTDSQVSDQLSSFKDSTSVSGWAKPDIAACLKAGVITGRTSTALCPKENITRAEVAVIVQRLLQKSGLI